MDDLYLALTVVFPLFFMMALGYLLNGLGMFTDELSKGLNALCFKVFLPCVLFLSIYNSDFYSDFSIELVLYACVLTIITFILLMIFIPKMVTENIDRGVVIQGFFRSNFVLFGIPVTQAIYGDDNIAVTAILIAFTVPLFNVLAVIALASYSNVKKSNKDILVAIMKNPLIIASVLGFLCSISGLKIPFLIVDTISDISKIASPLALIVLGAGFKFSNITKYLSQLIITVLGKIVILPGIGLGIAILLGFRGMELTALMVMLATPVGVSTFTMAQSAGGNDELAGQAIVMSSLLSILTVFLWIFTFNYFSLI